jgi:hypothetical protein
MVSRYGFPPPLLCDFVIDAHIIIGEQQITVTTECQQDHLEVPKDCESAVNPDEESQTVTHDATR